MSWTETASRRAAALHQKFLSVATPAATPWNCALSVLSALCFYNYALIDAYANQTTYRGAPAIERSAKNSFSANAVMPDSSPASERARRDSNDQRYGDERDFERFLQN